MASPSPTTPSSVVTLTTVRLIPGTTPDAIRYVASSGTFTGQASTRAIRLTAPSCTIGGGTEWHGDRLDPLRGARDSDHDLSPDECAALARAAAGARRPRPRSSGPARDRSSSSGETRTPKRGSTMVGAARHRVPRPRRLVRRRARARRHGAQRGARRRRRAPRHASTGRRVVLVPRPRASTAWSTIGARSRSTCTRRRSARSGTTTSSTANCTDTPGSRTKALRRAPRSPPRSRPERARSRPPRRARPRR